MKVNRFRSTLLGVVMALIGLAMVFMSVNAQESAPVDPGVAEFGADAFIRILLEDCPNCATDSAEAAADDRMSLLVEFVGGTDEQRAAVEQVAAQWAEDTSIDFQFGEFEDSDIRIVFGTEGAGTSEPADVSVTALVDTGDSSRLNIRSGPAASFKIIGKAYNGSTYNVIGRNATGDWLQLFVPDLAGKRGWVSARFVEVAGNLLQTPEVAAETGTGSQVDKNERRPVAPAPASLSGQLAVPVWDEGSGTYSIYVVDADGANLRQVVDNASSPALSPDGERLAFRSWDRDGRGIVVAAADGSAPARLTSFLEDVLPSWSADGQRITFSSYRENDRNSRIYYLWADQQKDWVLKRGQEAVYGEDPYWMADGRIAYTLHNLLPEDQLLTMAGDGSEPDVLLNDTTVRSPAVSPDGQYIALMSMRNGNWDVYRLNIDGSGLVQLTDHAAMDGLPTWSPDGQSIAFVSDRDGLWGLWVMDADGRNQRLLTALPGSVDGVVRDELDYVTNGWLEEQISWSP